MPVDATVKVLEAAGGDFFLLLFGIMFMFVLGLCSWLVYQLPKQFELSTTRIVGQLIDITNEQKALRKCYEEHDEQAKEILRLNEKIDNKTEKIENRVNGFMMG